MIYINMLLIMINICVGVYTLNKLRKIESEFIIRLSVYKEHLEED